MSAAATLRAVDVLRREVHVAAPTGGIEGMNDIEVVSLEVGALDILLFTGRRLLDYNPKERTMSWTQSEKLPYGPAWELHYLLKRDQLANLSANLRSGPFCRRPRRNCQPWSRMFRVAVWPSASYRVSF